MRIGLVIYGSLDTVSGGYLYDRRLVEYLRAQGDRVEIVSLPWQTYPQRLMHNLQSAWLNAFAALDVDILLQDELAHPSLLRVNRALQRRSTVPRISIVHHLRASEDHPGVVMGLYRRVERAYLRSVDGFIYNSQTTRVAVEALRGSPARCVVATPAGDRFQTSLNEAAISQRSQQPGPLRLVYVGNVIQRKGLHRVLQALAQVQPADWRLDVSGKLEIEPAYGRQVRALAAPFGERVKLWGGAADDVVRELLAGAHLLVMPSFYEGFGIVYLEGMAFGLPALATQSGSAREIIQDGVNGFLVPRDDPTAIASVFAALQEDRHLLERVSLAARRRFADFPGWDDSMCGIRDFLLGWM